MKTAREKLEIIFKPECMSATAALTTLIEIADRLGKSLEVAFDTTRVSAEEFRMRTELSGKWSHEIKLDDVTLAYGIVAPWEHCFISITQSIVGRSVDWVPWLKPFLWKPGFIQAWIADVDYNHWQNAEQPIEYKLSGRDHAHLPRISNGLPSPLEDMWIDISKNPGRRVLKKGYVEAVGDKMWLDRNFIARIGGINIERLRVAGWRVRMEEGGAIMAAPSGTFSEESATEHQQQLRTALYN